MGKPKKATKAKAPATEQLRADVDRFQRTAAGLANDVADLKVTVRVLDKVLVAVNGQLLRQILVIRDLLVANQVVTAEEALAAAQLAELDAMLDRSEERRNLDG